MFVLGIDPGLTRCGYAIIEPGKRGGGKARAIGVIRTDPKEDLARRLAEIRFEMIELMDEFSPTVLAIEKIFFQNNVNTAIPVAHVSGIIMAEAAGRDAHVAEYTPSQIKAAVAGDGRADKKQMTLMVQQLLGLSAAPKPADAADAAAVALCHLAHDPSGKMATAVTARPLHRHRAVKPESVRAEAARLQSLEARPNRGATVSAVARPASRQNVVTEV